MSYDEAGYYDEYGNWVATPIEAYDDPNEAKIDAEGRLIDEQKLWEM